MYLETGKKKECKRWMNAALWMYEVSIGGGKEGFLKANGPILQGPIREYL